MKIDVKLMDTEDRISRYVEENPIEIYIDYRDELSTDQVSKILEGKADEVREQIEMDAFSFGIDDMSYYKENMAEELDISAEAIDKWFESEDGFYPSYCLTDHDWSRLLKNTSVYISAIVDDATWCFNNWAYGQPIEYRDFKVALKLLGVNPKEFMETKTGGGNTTGDGSFKGWWPDMPNREPKVNIKDLFDQMLVLYDGEMTFLLGDLEEVIEVLSSDSKEITFKKGTPVVMYNWGVGSGIVDIELTADLTIKRNMVEFRNDKDFRYGIQECYGFYHNYWEEGSVQNGK